MAVVGGGISGLAAAHRITELLPDAEVAVFEASSRPGGVLETIRGGGFLIERSADSFITKLPDAVDLCRRLGIDEQLLPTDEAKRRAMVVCRATIATGATRICRDDTWRCLVAFDDAGINLARQTAIVGRTVDREVRRKRTDVSAGDESVASFATRRLGHEAYERLVQPLLAGIYTADPERLSMAATLPDLFALDREGGSLWRRTTTSDSGARYGMFVAPREGMESLVQAIVNRLPIGSDQVNTRSQLCGMSPDTWLVDVEGEAQATAFDAVVVALPAYAAARLMAECEPELAERIGGNRVRGMRGRQRSIPARAIWPAARRVWIRRATDRKPTHHRRELCK